MSQADNKRMEEEEAKAEKFARLAKMKGWYCNSGRHDAGGGLIEEWEYDVYKMTGRCSSCQHDYEKTMSE